MKKLIPFIILTFSLFLFHSCVKANDNLGHGGRCTGSSNCKVCVNCSQCGYCRRGGTCSKCSGKSSGGSYKKSKPQKNASSKNNSGKMPKIELNVNINSNNRYLAGIGAVNIYEKPSTQSKIITTVSKNAKLIQLSKEGQWYKVQVKSSDKKGYVSNKDVK